MEFKGKLSEAVPNVRGIRICWNCEFAWEDDCLIGTHVECPNGCGLLWKYDSIEYAIRQIEGRIEYSIESMECEELIVGAKKQLKQLKELAIPCE